MKYFQQLNSGTLLSITMLLIVVLGCGKTSPPKDYVGRVPVLVEDVVLQPGEWRSWPFQVTEAGSRINGSFSTPDGKEHEILLYVTDPESKDTLQTKNTGRYAYRSIDSKNRRMNSVLTDLDTGEYYLLFRNESKDVPHTVRIRMYLEY